MSPLSSLSLSCANISQGEQPSCVVHTVEVCSVLTSPSPQMWRSALS